MRQSLRRLHQVPVAALWCIFLAAAPPLPGQARPTLAASLCGGYSSYDLAGTGGGFVAAVGLSWSPVKFLVLEPGMSFFTYKPDFVDTRQSYLFPELSIQAQAGSGRVLPFIGVGAGGSFVVGGIGRTQGTLHATIGLRMDVGDGWGLRTEARARSVDPWVGNTLDILVGLSRRLS